MMIKAGLLVLVAVLALAASPARADRCDDLAAQLKSQITGLGVGKTVANSIYLSHPAAKRLRLGCSSRNVQNEVSATSDSRKPKPAFFDLVARMTAIVFTIPRNDAQRGATRCVGRMGFLRGSDVRIRYRRLNMHCTRTKADATITISRNTDE